MRIQQTNAQTPILVDLGALAEVTLGGSASNNENKRQTYAMAIVR
ncbi:albusnodin family lasso peptide [Actinocorallia sp. A-T 12471]|nr:albusnodin family lasso peptide [Actinocorallia sp. A-T 12471]MDX6744565.1 albusnodin family lasso peptide [Actinocorallia sp. A-T 12471]